MSTRESWPGEPSELDPAEEDPAEEDDVYEDDEDTGDESESVDEDDDGGDLDDAEPELKLAGHAPGELNVPDDVELLEGEPRGTRRGVAVVAARFNGDITNRLLESALGELEQAGIARSAITVMAVPGAFELPIGAMALAKTRRYSCVVALGCVIRGETAHFDFVAAEAASGLQLASLETGVPVAFGVLTVDTLQQAMARTDKGAEAVRTALEMADVFHQLRKTAQAS